MHLDVANEIANNPQSFPPSCPCTFTCLTVNEACLHFKITASYYFKLYALALYAGILSYTSTLLSGENWFEDPMIWNVYNLYKIVGGL